jgi:hypothetical protein
MRLMLVKGLLFLTEFFINLSMFIGDKLIDWEFKLERKRDRK